MLLSLENILELVLRVGGGEGNDLGAEVADHVHDLGFVSFDAWNFYLLES